MTSTRPRTSGASAGDAARQPLRAAIWDLPTRLFHWALVMLIGVSWWTAEQNRDEWHIWSGYAVLFLLLFRLLWGLFGSSTARFSAFVRGPRAILAYVRDVRGWRGVGHTPLGALSVVALLLLLTAQVGLGLVLTDDGITEGPLAQFVSYDTAERAAELHDVLFNVLLALIGLHVAAILFYRVAFGKRLVGPMISGIGELDPGTEPMRPGGVTAALACAAAAAALTGWIVAGVPPLGA